MKSEILLEQGLARLQLPFFAKHHAAISSEAAQAAWSHARFLETLVVGEVARRDEALIQRRVKAARLPGIKTLDQFDWSWIGTGPDIWGAELTVRRHPGRNKPRMR